MNISIYQIEQEKDLNRVKFESLENTLKYQGSDKINSDIYKKVYEGDVECKNLEEVYTMFNINHPAEFKGHSLSVSDVVEVKGGCADLVGNVITSYSIHYTKLYDAFNIAFIYLFINI